MGPDGAPLPIPPAGFARIVRLLSVIFYWVYDVINLIAESAHRFNRDASEPVDTCRARPRALRRTTCALSSREFSARRPLQIATEIYIRIRKLSSLWAFRALLSFAPRFGPLTRPTPAVPSDTDRVRRFLSL